jgi:OPT family oligopeptide transporter
MPVLKQFSWLCMIVSNNKLLAQLTSVRGFGITSLQFDWYSMTTSFNSPIIVPRWAQVNLFIGFILCMWFAGPLIYYLNLWDTRNLPIRSINIFTRNGTLYDFIQVADDQFHLNMTAYNEYNEKYGPIRLSTRFITLTATNMAFLPALLVHTLLYHGKWIVQQARTPFSKRNNDIHCKLMTYYSETPEWCFLALFFVCLITATLVSHFTRILPGYYVLLAVSIGCITVLPYSIFIAQTAQNRLLTISLTCFFLGAVIVPSNPFGLDAFVNFIIRIQNQTLTILLFLKISHFMKLPPRVVFVMVILSTILSSIVSYLTSEYFLLNIPNICNRSLNPDWACTTLVQYFSKAIFFAIIRKLSLF